jgi:hypothetical protein
MAGFDTRFPIGYFANDLRHHVQNHGEILVIQ